MAKDPYAPYRQQALPRPLLKELSQVHPWRVMGDTALAWIAIVAAWTGVSVVFRIGWSGFATYCLWWSRR